VMNTELKPLPLHDVTCLICRDYLMDPVTIECGHKFCLGCISQRCEGVETVACPQCGEMFQKRAFRPDMLLGNIIQFLKQRGLKPGQRGRKGNVCEEQGKELTRFCMEDVKALREDCKGSPAHCSHAVIPMAKAAHESQVGVFLLGFLKVHINDANGGLSPSPLCPSSVTPPPPLLLSPPLPFLLPASTCPLPSSDTFPASPAPPTLSPSLFLTGRWALTDLRQPDPPSPTPAPGPDSVTLSPVDVTLDPDTAHPKLFLSKDRKSVKHGDTRQDLPNNPERFDSRPCVLGAEGFRGGRRYWEVEVGDKTRWDLGVCRESLSRKGNVTYTPKDGYWVVWLWDGEYKAFTSHPTPLPVSVRPRRVGIFLDYEAGEVSFYNVTDRSHLFTFTDTFRGKLRPYFCPDTASFPFQLDDPVENRTPGNPQPSPSPVPRGSR
uniref:Uncharacterized protein n=1 Tax=Chelydra serpentina TaxID=8475 RepID=A0A8C3XLT1_CHESE